MVIKDNKLLFKDKVGKIKKNTKQYYDLVNELIIAIKDNKLKQLLFGTITIEPFLEKNNKKNRLNCNGFSTHASRGDYHEKRLCKCLYYKNNPDTKKNCELCLWKDRCYLVDNDFKIVDYEDRSFYKGNNIGEIDITILNRSNGIKYDTEVKPTNKINKDNNKEHLLRMISEILTYTYNEGITYQYNDNKYEKAIAFFENTDQFNEYNEHNYLIDELLEIAEINVFLFKKNYNTTDKEEFEIIKLK